MRILLVGDDTSLGGTIQSWLRLDQHAVDWGRRGDSVFTALRAYQYDCVRLEPGIIDKAAPSGRHDLQDLKKA